MEFINVLPVVIYITNGTITNWGTIKIIQLGGSIDLAAVTFLIIYTYGLELDSIYFKKCTHAMAMGTSSSILHIILNHA